MPIVVKPEDIRLPKKKLRRIFYIGLDWQKASRL